MLISATLAVVTLAPVAFVVVGSFDVAAPGQGVRLGFDGWQQAFVRDRQTLNAIGYTFLLSLRAPLAVCVGFVLAWLLVRARIPGSKLIEFGFWLAFFLPPLPVALGWILLLDPNYGLANTWLKTVLRLHASPLNIFSVGGVMWVHLTTSTVPIMVILLAPALRRFDAGLEDSARTCGCSLAQMLRRITLPLLAPAIITALIAGIIRSLESFEVEQLLGAPARIQVYSTRIYNYINYDPAQFPPAMALSTVFLGLLLVLALVYQRYSNRHQYVTVGPRGSNFQARDLGAWGYVVSSACSALLIISVATPVTLLVVGSLMRGFGFFTVPDPFTTAHWTGVLHDPAFVHAVATSLQVGLAVGLVGTLLYALLAYAMTRTKLWGRGLMSVLSWMPWAVPGILLGMGLLWLIVTAPGLNLLYGTVGGLILALMAKEMPLGTQMIRTTLFQLSVELEQAARASGAGWLYTYRKIVLPLAAPMLLTVFLLAFVGSLRDISTTILLSSAAAKPLSVLMLEYAGSGNVESATVLATIVTVVSLSAALVARRVGSRFSLASA